MTARPTEATLRNVARLYDLVAEMNAVTTELRADQVMVEFGGFGARNDPLRQTAVVRITLKTGASALHDV